MTFSYLYFHLHNQNVQHAGVDLDTLDNVALFLKTVRDDIREKRIQTLDSWREHVVDDLERNDDTKVTQSLEPGENLSLNIRILVFKTQRNKPFNRSLYDDSCSVCDVNVFSNHINIYSIEK